MIAPLLIDPFENELTLAPEPRVISFAARGLELPLDELVRHLAFDVVGAIPRPLGEVQEAFPEPGAAGSAARARPFSYKLRSFAMGPATLALATEISEPEAQHRVIELLGVGEDVRVRVNMTRLLRPDPSAHPAIQQAIAAGRALGQVRIWAGESGAAGELRRTLSRQLTSAGIDSQVLVRDVPEPVYRPPAAARFTLDMLPQDDARVAAVLVSLLSQHPVPGAPPRPARQVGAHQSRVRKATTIVSHAWETHRAGSGVLHMRRREVEAGVERPGLVRTFNLAGLRGAARVRIRDVGGRVTAELAGTGPAVEALVEALQARLTLGGRS